MAKHLQVNNLLYAKGFFFLNTGVMSVNFSLSGNSQFDNDSLKSFCNVVAVVSELNSITKCSWLKLLIWRNRVWLKLHFYHSYVDLGHFFLVLPVFYSLLFSEL